MCKRDVVGDGPCDEHRYREDDEKEAEVDRPVMPPAYDDAPEKHKQRQCDADICGHLGLRSGLHRGVIVGTVHPHDLGRIIHIILHYRLMHRHVSRARITDVCQGSVYN